jgi:Mat/Ecp fimbriae major subunit
MRRPLALLAALAFAASTAQAQNTANVNATATVVTPLTLTLASGAIDFATVFPGTTPAAIAPASGAKLVASGYQTSQVDFRFTAVPATLDDGSGNSLNVSFQYCLDNDDSAASCAQSGNAATATPYLINLAGGSAQLWLGATLGAVGVGQAAGSYNGTVSVSVNYTGS